MTPGSLLLGAPPFVHWPMGARDVYLLFNGKSQRCCDDQKRSVKNIVSLLKSGKRRIPY